ncbi:hypothetical protein QBC46DRAFT_382795 [Diplogelasinospora grovesii]|uniref:Infection structure specific protein n=1 Tax=Diplogelasinospora grovesii TaxID=303347 RepID=A0AAN6N951_9PEZI|nr:hypothetical protein QBC46DRAFT_382795 [Diplogelasinospora grovesii]
MHTTTTLLLALTASASGALAHIPPNLLAARQASSDVPAVTDTPSVTPSATATLTDSQAVTSAPSTSISLDYAACVSNINSIYSSINLLPTPNAALVNFLHTEAASVSDPCSWIADTPSTLSSDIMGLSSEIVSVISANAAVVTAVESCLSAAHALNATNSVFRQAAVTPYFGLASCTAVPTGSGSGSGTNSTTSGYTLPTSTGGAGKTGGASSTSSQNGGARETGAAVFAGVVAMGFLCVVGVL